MSILDALAGHIATLYDYRCSIVNYVSSKDENGITSNEKVVVAENIPCRISYKNSLPGVQKSTTDNISQEIKLFMTNKINVKPGSEITVTKEGFERVYISSGIPSVYTAHQEIVLTDKEEFA